MRRRFMRGKQEFLHFALTSNQNVETKIMLLKDNMFDGLKYSIGGTGWKDAETSIIIPPKETVYLKATGCNSSEGSWSLPDSFAISGNIMSLVYGDDFLDKIEIPKGNSFQYLFYYSGVISVDSNFLPATILTDGCYSHMFYYCNSLRKAPELPATILAPSCYSRMFYYCKNLNYIKAMFTTMPSSSYTSYWVNGVATSGTFVKNKDATWDVTGVNGVPSGWTIIKE